MHLARWVLAAGIAFAPGLALMGAGCVATQAVGSPRLAVPAPPSAADPEAPDDPCADPEALDGLDDPCYVDVPAAEVEGVIAAGRRGRRGGPDGKAQE